jgi:Transglutaminase-like superfamily
MDPSRKSLPLPSHERWLLIKAALLLEAIKLSLHLLPFQTLVRLLARVADAPIGPWHIGDYSADRVACAVEMASRRTPGAKSCLTQALAARVLLDRRGYPTLLHIGVAKGEQGQFRAHAWLESEGKVVVGGSELDPFTPLTILMGGKSKGPRE